MYDTFLPENDPISNAKPYNAEYNFFKFCISSSLVHKAFESFRVSIRIPSYLLLQRGLELKWMFWK